MEKFTVCRDREFYKAWPDVALASDGHLICVFNECIHHMDRSNTRIALCESYDRGRTWLAKRPFTEETAGREYYYNCPRICCLRDGTLVILVDRMDAQADQNKKEKCRQIVMWRSKDNGQTWGDPESIPLNGIVPDKLLELDSGRWLISAHRNEDGMAAPFCVYSDDKGMSWSHEILMAYSPDLRLVEASLLALGGSEIVAFLRENSGMGYDCKKVISVDGGASWGDLIDFPLPGCHRPVSGRLHGDSVLITYRFMQGGGRGRWGGANQNFFAALTDVESARATSRNDAWVHILPVDHDRSAVPDLGYSGHVQFPDGEIYIVGYIVDDAVDLGQIRGYSLNFNDFLLKTESPKITEGVK